MDFVELTEKYLEKLEREYERTLDEDARANRIFKDYKAMVNGMPDPNDATYAELENQAYVSERKLQALWALKSAAEFYLNFYQEY